MFRQSRIFFRNAQGSISLEYAFVIPSLIFGFFFILEITLWILFQNALDSTAKDLSRIQRGQNTFPQYRAYIEQKIIGYSGRLMKPENLRITLQKQELENLPEPFEDTNLNGNWDPGEFYIDTDGDNQWDAQGAKDLQGYHVTLLYDWNTLIPFIGNQGILTLKSETTVFVQGSFHGF